MTFEEDDELNLEELSPLMQALMPKMTGCRIREYQPEDLDACLEVQRSNQVQSADTAESERFAEFLEIGTSYVLVIEHDGDIIACGGLEMVGDPDSATVVYTMVHREYQRRGFGSSLLAAQLSLLEPEDRPIDLWVSGSDEAAGFYEQMGFQSQVELGAARMWLSVAPEDVADARAALLERNVQLVLNADEDEDGEDGDIQRPGRAERWEQGYEEEEE